MKALKTLALIVAGIVALWMTFYPTGRVPYRLTVEVETPEGVMSGSGVRVAYYFLEPPILPGTGASAEIHGEAFPVDLGSRGALFVLLASRSDAGRPDYNEATDFLDIMTPEWRRSVRSAAQTRALNSLSIRTTVPVKFMPFLVRFRNEKDAATVEAVDPENLAASFGPGVRLKQMTMETVSRGWWPLNEFGLTGEPMTRGIEKRLGWLKSLKTGSITGNTLFEPDIAPENYLTGGAFRRGVR